MKKMYIDYEMRTTDNAETTGSVRIIAADKIRFEAISRLHGWPIEDGPRALALMLHAALQRTHQVPTDVDFDDFTTDVLIDFAVRSDDADTEADPTR